MILIPKNTPSFFSFSGLILIFSLLLLQSNAQPQKVNYQAVALTAGGQTVKNQAIKLRLSIVDSSATGTVLYTETHSPTTDGFGQFSVYLGGGTATLGTFSNVPWSNGKDKFLKAEADVTGGTNYVHMGTSQMVSVPYALAAGSSLSSTLLTDSFGNSVTIKYDTNGNPFIALIPKPIPDCGQTINYFGETYPTLQIGTQCWMTKNINLGTMVLGTINQTNNGIIEKYCYDNNPANCNIYGGLYQWAEAVQYQNGASNSTSPNPAYSSFIQGICPTGWHIPNKFEFCKITTFLDSTVNCNIGTTGTVVGRRMKENNFWANGIFLNSGGFSVLPGGNRDEFGRFSSALAPIGSFLFSFEDLTNSTFCVHFYPSSSIHWDTSSKQSGLSVRCLKD